MSTDQFILRIGFCEKIKQIDAPSLTYRFTMECIFESRRYGRYRWYCYYDDATGYGVHSQHIFGNLAQHRKSRSAVSQSDWHKVGSVDGRSANRRSCNWRSKIHGKTKHSWSMINSEHQVNHRSVNRRSNLIWLATEKKELTAQCNGQHIGFDWQSFFYAK